MEPNTTNPPDVKSRVADARDLHKRVRLRMEVWIECGTEFERDFLACNFRGRWRMLMRYADRPGSRVDMAFSQPKRVEVGEVTFDHMNPIKEKSE